MSVIESGAREFWRTSTMLRTATGVTRRLALGRAMQNQGAAGSRAVSQRFVRLAAEYRSEINAVDIANGRRS